jgi:hypothetical protein
MRIWSLIKMVREQGISGTRCSVATLLLEHAHLTEDELVVVGLKHLHQKDGPKKRQPRNFDADDISEAVSRTTSSWNAR